MSYLHIDNLYKAQDILAFRTCYALEKIHGTSAHIAWHQGAVTFFSGGESASRFVALFDAMVLAERFQSRFMLSDTVVIYGEAYGGKQQGMRKTYGDALRFIAFDVQINTSWLAVPQAAELVAHLGVEFVDFAEVSTDLVRLDAERDKPSTQAVRNGILTPQLREGVVLRPPFEVRTNNGDRVIAKHKRPEFSERGRARVELDPTKRETLHHADAIAMEWVTPQRLEHVLDHILAARPEKTLEMRDIPAIVTDMIADILREAQYEIIDSKPARRAIGQRTVHLFKQWLTASLRVQP